MSTDQTFADQITGWLEAEAQPHLPDRVLRSSFGRTRATRQQRGWILRLGGLSVARFAPVLSSAAAVVAVAVLAVFLFSRQPGFVGQPSDAASPSTSEPTETAPASPTASPSAEPS